MRVRAAVVYLFVAMLHGALCVTALAGPREDAERSVERLHQQARELYGRGEYPQGLPLAQSALQICESSLAPDHPLTAKSLINLGNFRRLTGSYAAAGKLYGRALAIRERSLGAEHPDVAAVLNNLAILHGDMGDHSRAVSLQQRALQIRESVYGPQHLETAKSLGNLAILYAEMGDYAAAEPLYQQTLAIRERELGAHHRDTVATLVNLANLYLYTSAYARAATLYQRALSTHEQFLEAEHPDAAAVMNNLAQVYRATGDYEQARPLFERALAIREKTLGPVNPETAASLNNLGGMYRVMGEVERARPLYERGLALAQQVMGPTSLDTARALNNLANLYLDTGDYTKAAPLYTRALAIREKLLGAEHPEVAQALNNLGILEWARGRSARALGLLQRAQEIQDGNSERFLFSGSEARNLAYIQGLAEDHFTRVSFSVAAGNRAGVELGLSSVLQYKGRVLDAMSGNVARLRRSVKAEDRELMERLSHVANQSSTMLYRVPAGPASNKRLRRLSELSVQQDALESELARRSSEFREQAGAVTVARVSAALPADAVLVEWVRYKPFEPTAPSVKEQWRAPRYLAYVLERGGAALAIDMGDAAALEKLAGDFNRAVSDPRRGDVRQRAAELSDKLIKPLLPHLQGHARLLLSPDGALNLVSMAALLDDEDHYLAERFEITYLTSGRDLLRMNAPAREQGVRAVVMADPDFGAGPQPRQANASMQARYPAELDELVFRPLPGTALEARSLQEMLAIDPADVLMRLDASEQHLRELHGPRLLHIATHGFFLDAAAMKTVQSGAAPDPNPLLRSGLALAGANARRSGNNDDGILTALEMAQLDLRGTQLVVLSACETASGEAASGEGVYGLRRALVLAGAQTQITSLWQVADQATRTLMVDFYRHLLQGAGRSAALRAAQRSMMAGPRQSHPYYWAGFVPLGNWAPLLQR